jgi:hypothetical protein
MFCTILDQTRLEERNTLHDDAHVMTREVPSPAFRTGGRKDRLNLKSQVSSKSGSDFWGGL